MKRSSQKKLIIALACAVIVILAITFYTVDSARAANDQKPIFAIWFPWEMYKVHKDGGTRIYQGLGYRVIAWHKISFQTPDGQNKQGYMVGIEISTIFNLQDINDGPRKELQYSPK